MINIIQALKELQFAAAAKSGLAKVEADWKHGVVPGLVTLIITLGSLYSSFSGLIPPQYAFGAAVAVSVLYLLIEGFLRLHNQSMPTIAGIPAQHLDELLKLLEQKYPGLAKYEEPVKAIDAKVTGA